MIIVGCQTNCYRNTKHIHGIKLWKILDTLFRLTKKRWRDLNLFQITDCFDSENFTPGQNHCWFKSQAGTKSVYSGAFSGQNIWTHKGTTFLLLTKLLNIILN